MFLDPVLMVVIFGNPPPLDSACSIKFCVLTHSHVNCPQLSILQRIGWLNPDFTNIVKFYEQFYHLGQLCMVFEMLNRGLNDLLLEQQGVPLSLAEIRLIAKQVCFIALYNKSSILWIHSDLTKVQGEPNSKYCLPGFVPTAVDGFGHPDPYWYRACRHQAGQHHACQSAGPED